MSKYIDKDELWERLKTSMVHHIVTNTLFNTIKAVIDSMPSIDIVTCKECKYRKDRMFEVDEKGFCTETCIVFGKIIFNDSEFCNFGRKESDTE